MYGPIWHGFAALAGFFGAMVWAIGTVILLAVLIALIVLLARFLWFGTKASQRYLELTGSPAPRVRSAAAPAAATPAATAPKRPAATPTTTTSPPSAPVTAPRTRKPPVG
jgi:predicted lipid-binding transport protein (Tim44 family)